MNLNFQQLCKKIVTNLSVLGVSLSIYHTVNAHTSVKSLRDHLEEERITNSHLIEKVNNLVSENESNSKLENIIRKSFEDNDKKIELLSNKINSLIENKTYDDNAIIEVNNNMKDINNDLTDIIDQIIDDSFRSSIIDTEIINSMISYINSLNFFQTLAISHLFALILILTLLIELMSIYFSDYLLDKFNIKERYPKIHKLLELRRKFQRFYLIKDFIITFITLIIFTFINVILFISF